MRSSKMRLAVRYLIGTGCYFLMFAGAALFLCTIETYQCKVGTDIGFAEAFWPTVLVAGALAGTGLIQVLVIDAILGNWRILASKTICGLVTGLLVGVAAKILVEALRGGGIHAMLTAPEYIPFVVGGAAAGCFLAWSRDFSDKHWQKG